MRYLAIAAVFLAIPVLNSVLGQSNAYRRWGFAALGLLLFFGDILRIGGALISWPMWTGISKGVEISMTDALAIALLLSRPRRATGTPFWGFIAFYMVVLAFSLITSAVPMATFFVIWQFGRALLIFAVVAGECHQTDKRDSLMTGLALGLILQLGYVVQQKAVGVVQATGTMYHQNALGMMVELALIVLVAALLAGDRRKISWAGVVAGLVVVAGGGSRGTLAFASAGVAIVILISLVRGITPAKSKVLGFAVLGALIAAPISVATLKSRFGKNSMTTQDDQRPAFERAARAMSADHPFGIGANLYVTTANTQGYADRAGVAWNFANRSAPVHNAYLLARAETGWLGEIALILLLVFPVLSALKLAFKKRKTASGEFALGAAVGLSVNIVHNNYEYAFFIYHVLSIVFLNIGIIAAQVSLERMPGKSRRVRAAVAIREAITA
ncbi:O-antigen ligase family protein [Sphingomonas sp. RS2018]